MVELALWSRAMLKTPNNKARGVWGGKSKLRPLGTVWEGGYVRFY